IRPTTLSDERCADWRCSDGSAAESGRGDVRPQGVGHLGDHPQLLRVAGLSDRRRVLQHLRVAGLLDRTIDIAWNSPLAWLDSQRRSGGTCRAVAMRDTDRDRMLSYFVARREGPVRTL